MMPIVQRSLLIAVVAALCVSTPSAGRSEGAPTALGNALKLLLQEGPLSTDGRKVTATSLANACGALAGKVPALSPRESDWLDAEIEGGRIQALVGTVEFAKRQLRQVLLGCQQISISMAKEDAREIIQLAQWSSLAGALLQPLAAEHVEVLRGAGTMGITELDASSVSLFPDTARLIIERIVTPGLLTLAQER
jgi:hypothetical protein